MGRGSTKRSPTRRPVTIKRRSKARRRVEYKHTHPGRRSCRRQTHSSRKTPAPVLDQPSDAWRHAHPADIRRKSSVKTSSGRRQLRRMSRASEDDVTFRRDGGRRATVSTPDARRDVANFLPRSGRPADARNLRPGNHGRTKLNAEGERGTDYGIRPRVTDRPGTDHRRRTTRDRTPRDSARDTAPPGFGRSGLSADRIITAPDLSWSGQQSSNTVK